MEHAQDNLMDKMWVMARVLLFWTEREDWGFVISATLVFALALLLTALDFILIQKLIYRFGIVNAVGLTLFLIGVIIRLVGKRTLGKYYSYGLRTMPDHKLIKHGIYKHIRHPISLAAIIYDMGIPLFFSSLYGFLLMLGLIPLMLYRIKIEEKMLIEKIRRRVSPIHGKDQEVDSFHLLA